MDKLNKLGYTKVEVLVVIVLLGIVAFITINKTSYAFSVDASGAVNEVIGLIERRAEVYANDHLDIFNESSTAFINVGDLVDNGYMMANEDGLVTSPDDSKKAFNDNKIKLQYDKDEDKVIATFVD